MNSWPQAEIISLPTAVNTRQFEWEVSLWDYGLKRHGAKGVALLVDRNLPADARRDDKWIEVYPHLRVSGVADRHPRARTVWVPLNIQYALQQFLEVSPYADTQLLEVIDCDVVQIGPYVATDPGNDALIACDLYEDWHLHSRTSNQRVIAPYFEHGGGFYNGGFVPIVLRQGVLRKILPEWIACHIDMLQRDGMGVDLKWWAGMYALQAACEKNRIQMLDHGSTYIPGLMQYQPHHSHAHYCIDGVFDKHRYPGLSWASFPSNPFYELVRAWHDQLEVKS